MNSVLWKAICLKSGFAEQPVFRGVGCRVLQEEGIQIIQIELGFLMV